MGVQPFANYFWSSVLWSYIHGENAKIGGGGEGHAKRFGSLLKVFIRLNSIKSVFDLGKMSSRGAGLGCAKNIGAFFLDF